MTALKRPKSMIGSGLKAVGSREGASPTMRRAVGVA